MLRATLAMIAGLTFGAFLTGVVSVFLLEDLDARIHAGFAAFLSVLVEGVVFSTFVGIVSGALAMLGRALMGLRGPSPRPAITFLIAAVIAFLQYPGDYLTRRLYPSRIDAYLYAYILFAIVCCSAWLIAGRYRQDASRMH